ncbi:hypothetical protein ACETU7_28470 [Rhodococcus sp. 3Y1]
MSGRKDEAAAVVPDEMVTETMIIGNVDEVRADVKRWEEAGVTMLLVTCRDADHVRARGRGGWLSGAPLFRAVPPFSSSERHVQRI